MFQKNSGIEIFQAKEGGSFTVLSKFFVSQDRNEKLCEGTLLFSRKFRVSENFMDEGGGEYHDFLSKSFLSHSAEKFHKGTL